MNLLAIESASTVCGVALFIDGQLKELNEITKPKIHGERLPVIVENLLNSQSMNKIRLNGIAISSGPGSYTGLRIGMNLSKGLAASMKIPIIPVPTLYAMNYSIQHEGIYWLMLHSHKDQVYIQRFKTGVPDSEIKFEKFHADKYPLIYGFNLDKICDKYVSVAPSSSSVGNLAIKNYAYWANHDLNRVSPNYINNFNI